VKGVSYSVINLKWRKRERISIRRSIKLKFEEEIEGKIRKEKEKKRGEKKREIC